MALDGASVEPGAGKPAISGSALEELARQYLLANSVSERLSNWMDVEALRAIADGLMLDLDSTAAAEASAVALQQALHDAEVAAEFDARTDKHLLRISRRHHGNIKSSVITQDFVHGADYEALAKAGVTFHGLLGSDAIVKRGEGERQKEQKVADFRAAMAWLMGQAEHVVSRQRYKGLGEMNPSQLWETTMDPTVRRLLRVQIDDAIEADRVFTMLMGDEVEPRRTSSRPMRCGRGTSTFDAGQSRATRPELAAGFGPDRRVGRARWEFDMSLKLQLLETFAAKGGRRRCPYKVRAYERMVPDPASTTGRSRLSTGVIEYRLDDGSADRRASQRRHARGAQRRGAGAAEVDAAAAARKWRRPYARSQPDDPVRGLPGRTPDRHRSVTAPQGSRGGVRGAGLSVLSMVPKPEQQAREAIDRLLDGAGWSVQDFKAADLQAASGVALREFEANPGHGTAG